MKSFLVLIILIFLTACTNIEYTYSPENYKNSDISISASLVKFDNESSPLSYIWIYDLRNHYRNREKEPYYNVKILSSTIKINSNGKGIITGDFTAYIGKVQLDNGKIIDIPPLKFKKHVLIEKYNGLDDAFSKGVPRKEIFNGTVENYKKQKK